MKSVETCEAVMRKQLELKAGQEFLRQAILSVSPENFMKIFNGAYSWNDVFEGSDDAEFILRVIETLDKNEVEELFRPYIAEYLQEEIGAKKVTIQW